jgi:hypothetical protein
MFGKKELRICSECGMILYENELRKHSIATGHSTFTIISLDQRSIITKILEHEGRIRKLEEALKLSKEVKRKE